MASAAMVIVGLILVFVGISGGGQLEWVGLGVLALVAAGVLQILSSRRT